MVGNPDFDDAEAFKDAFEDLGVDVTPGVINEHKQFSRKKRRAYGLVETTDPASLLRNYADFFSINGRNNFKEVSGSSVKSSTGR